MVWFSYELGQWDWDKEKLESIQASDNVLDFMINLLEKLPQTTQDALKFGACIDNYFECTLALITEQPEKELLVDLADAFEEEILLIENPTKFTSISPLAMQEKINIEGRLRKIRIQFQHDRVQQAAYSLIEEKQKPTVHLKIGRLLKQNKSNEEIQEKIFEIVNQLGAGKALIENEQEKEELIKLYLLAGRKAKSVSASERAYYYFNAGIDLLGEKSWEAQKMLSVFLYQEAAEAAFLAVKFEEAEKLAEILLKQDLGVLERVKVYEILVHLYMAQHDPGKAIETGFKALKLLNIIFPKDPKPFHIITSLLQTKLVFLKNSPESLQELPSMEDPYQLAVMNFLPSIIPATFNAAPNLFPLIIFKMVRLSLKFGNAASSPLAYANYGLILSGPLGKINTGYRFGQLALALMKQIETHKYEAGALFVVNFFINHWKMRNIEPILEGLLKAIKSGLEKGDTEIASYAAGNYCTMKIITGAPLTQLVNDMEMKEILKKNQTESKKIEKNGLKLTLNGY